MEANYISYEALVASREAADWALWAMLGTWFSGVVTLVAACVAFLALRTWKQQEKHNERKALKSSLINYRNLLLVMPVTLNPQDPNCRQLALLFQESMNQIYLCVTLMEVNLKTHEIGKEFYTLFTRHSEYMRGEVSHEKVAELLLPFISKPFISGEYSI